MQIYLIISFSFPARVKTIMLSSRPLHVAEMCSTPVYLLTLARRGLITWYLGTVTAVWKGVLRCMSSNLAVLALRYQLAARATVKRPVEYTSEQQQADYWISMESRAAQYSMHSE